MRFVRATVGREIQEMTVFKNPSRIITAIVLHARLDTQNGRI